jgi:hypothetical protein
VGRDGATLHIKEALDQVTVAEWEASERECRVEAEHL